MESPKETPAQRQARLRRERRQAKIQAGGASRLQAITSLSGHPPPAETSAPVPPLQPQPQESATPTAAVSPLTQHTDREKSDISQHYYTPVPSSTDAIARSPDQQPFAGLPADAAAKQDDPMFQMLQAMMRGEPPDPGAAQDAAQDAGLPPAFARILNASQQPAQQEEPAPSSTYIWRIIHAVVSLCIALYAALWTEFDGSLAGRTRLAHAGWEDEEEVAWHQKQQRLFWMFATAELVLQSSRFFLEKGQLSGSGVLGWLSQVLPEPLAGYARVVGRYGVMYTTIVTDVMVVVFVLGVVAWWRGMVE